MEFKQIKQQRLTEAISSLLEDIIYSYKRKILKKKPICFLFQTCMYTAIHILSYSSFCQKWLNSNKDSSDFVLVNLRQIHQFLILSSSVMSHCSNYLKYIVYSAQFYKVDGTAIPIL